MSTNLSAHSQLSWDHARRTAMRRRSTRTAPAAEPQTTLWNELPSLLSIAMLVGLVAYLCLR